MLDKLSWENSRAAAVTQAGLIFVLLFWAATAFGQTTGSGDDAQTIAAAQTEKSAEAKAALMPVLKNYRDITVGMTADEVKDKLDDATLQKMLDNGTKEKKFVVALADIKSGNALKNGKFAPLTPQQAKKSKKKSQ